MCVHDTVKRVFGCGYGGKCACLHVVVDVTCVNTRFSFVKVYATARAEKSEAQCTFMHRARQVVHTVAPEFSLAKLSRLLKPKAIPIPTIML